MFIFILGAQFDLGGGGALNNKEKMAFFANLTISAVGISLFAFVFFKFLFVPLLPFVIAWGAAFIIRPAAVFISKKLHLPRKLVSAALAIIGVSACLVAAVGLIWYALSEVFEFLSRIAQDDGLFNILSVLTNPLGTILGNGEGVEKLEEYLGETVKGAISHVLNWLVDILTGIVKGIPSVAFFILITVIASVYFALDIDRINRTVRSVLPAKVASILVNMKNSFFSVGLKYIRSYLLLMVITFAIIFTGLLILKVDNALLISLVVSVLDLLPLIGVGMILVPWGIFQILFGSVPLGIGLFILLGVSTVIRQFAEPKILGKNLGMHPIISLLLLYIGYSVLGIGGLLLVPIASVIINILIKKNNSSKIS